MSAGKINISFVAVTHNYWNMGCAFSEPKKEEDKNLIFSPTHLLTLPPPPWSMHSWTHIPKVLLPILSHLDRQLPHQRRLKQCPLTLELKITQEKIQIFGNCSTQDPTHWSSWLSKMVRPKSIFRLRYHFLTENLLGPPTESSLLCSLKWLSSSVTLMARSRACPVSANGSLLHNMVLNKWQVLNTLLLWMSGFIWNTNQNTFLSTHFLLFSDNSL